MKQIQYIKWKNVRDSYKKSIDGKTNIGSGSAAQKKNHILIHKLSHFYNLLHKKESKLIFINIFEVKNIKIILLLNKYMQY